MYWANFLHFYQPPGQKKYWVDRVAQESYRKIIKGLLRYPAGKLTLNINACLLELFDQFGHQDIIKDIKTLLKQGQLELTGSAKYHPLLPMIPETEIIRQIKINDATCCRYFGRDYQAKGFFPPEMGFSFKIAKIVSRLGFKWIIVDEASYPENFPDYSKIYKIKGLPLEIYFRERAMSFKILSAQLGTGSLLVRDLGERMKKHEYLLTAMDGETFGHHRLGLEKVLFDIYQSKELKTCLMSDLAKLFPEGKEITPISSSWALMHKEMTQREPFSRWHDPKNQIHRFQWQLTKLVLQAIAKASHRAAGFKKARHLVDIALHSDQYWWASARPWWSLEMIEKGAKDLLDALKVTPSVSKQDLQKGQELYYKIIETGFRWQKEGIVDALVQEHYDEEVKYRLDTSAPVMREDEFKSLIQHLRRQMLEAARHYEYERAAQFHRRIRELLEERRRIIDGKKTKPDFDIEKEWGL